MADVFLSYSREDRPLAERISLALEHAGYSVWWDRNLPGGSRFAATIESELELAKAVLVLWTKASITSDWVIDEAQAGRDSRRLVPVTTDGSSPPLGFRQFQVIDLGPWTGLPDDPALQVLLATLAGLALPGGVAIDDDRALEQARAAYQGHQWEPAYRRFQSIEASRPLDPEDLERHSWAAFWTARYPEALDLLEHAEARYSARGDSRGMARTALQQSRFHFDHGNFGVASGLYSRARRLLAQESECAEHGLMACNAAGALLGERNPEAARVQAQLACDIARRVGDRDTEAMGLLWLSRAFLLEGRLSEATALCDEATALATSGSIDPFAAGWIYCSAITDYRNRADWQRAGEWTERADRWCQRESVAYFPGTCRVHRAEVVRFHGDLDDAERHVLQGCTLLTAASRTLAPLAFRELAEIRLRRGDLAGTEAACQSCVELGRDPQPVLALLRLAQGDARSALAAIDRALADPLPWNNLNRIHLLPAKVTIALAAGERDAAAVALTELEHLAETFATQGAIATAVGARGEFELREGHGESAVRYLRQSVTAWCDLQGPFEAARARCLLAEAYLLEGDPGAATMELRSALSGFEALHAELDVKRARAQLEGMAA